MTNPRSQTSTQSASARAARAIEEHLAQFGDEDMAYHEAGHAVIHRQQGGIVRRLSIERADPRRGAQIGPRKDAERGAALGNQIAVLVAGDVAGTLHGTAENVTTAGSRVDYDQAFRAAAEAGFDPDEARAIVDAKWERVRDRLREPAAWQQVQALAQELLRRKTLDEAQIGAILTP
ncbi:MAG TPA: hypothetical protein VFX49_21660 [Chloroflexota bacterium]|nr:hypothetical protein [Chloroflexota bacterium]